MNEDLRTPEQRAKIERLDDLRKLLVSIAHNTVDMIFDDVDSISDAHELYDVNAMVSRAQEWVDDGVDLIYVMETVDAMVSVRGVNQ
jgi:hypothetical protein